MTRAYNTATTQQNSGGAVNPFAAGKNKIINGDFGIWQRGTSLTVSNQNQFLADRWKVNYGVALPTSWTISQQAFTAGTAPVAGYESTFFIRSAITTLGSAVSCRLVQPIEDVRTFAGQTVTLSFWAKADTNRTIVAYLTQDFGSGGSTEVNTSLESVAVTSSWTRYTRTWTLASVSGKTIGTSSALQVRLQNPDSASTIDYWGVQLEAGSVATAFQTATGTIQGELAACQRYFQYYKGGIGLPYPAFTSGTTLVYGSIQMPIIMRSAPSVSLGGTLYFFNSAAEFGIASPTVDYSNLFVGGGRLRIGGATGLTSGLLTTAYSGDYGFISLSSEL